MLEKDKVFCFVEGLKLWARTKLYEQKVQDLASALAAAERLFDYGGDQSASVEVENRGHKQDESCELQSFANCRVEIQKVLNDYVNIMPLKLSKTLPPRRRIDHKIKFVIGTKPPAKNAYRMAPPELAELRNYSSLEEHKVHLRSLKDSQEGFSRRIAPLTKLLKKGTIWRWPVECQTTFDDLKVTMIKGPILGLVNVLKSFVVKIDALDFALGGILTQEGHSITYESPPMHSSKVDASMHGIIREFIQKDPSVQAVVALAKVDKARQFWVEEDLLLTKENRLYVSRAGDLRKKLLYECHDMLWTCYPGWQMTYFLLKKGYF
ncbi:reverse transcriptase [Cucumis melo var. makuwa]|uniref:Reverse transcriptase n=1 Tax=Cucumis melo var. makuwa TaxID=1194695 RepID=A0A5D3BRG2_CUCMM|nr:reverse transcriptase [Cucumis melo var. makuwa]TYK02321.1 reverse transcriptase [Cucumis melo var. makuwa]